jgi:hypothetical protein
MSEPVYLPGYVSVPKDLLATVLDEAAGNSVGVEGEFACSDEDHAQYKAERDRIDELRRIAGIE